MPINVSCRECLSEFRVGDEFAGKPGRCPHCAAIILVPETEPGGPELHIDPSPYHTPRAVEAYEELPTWTRRRDPENPIVDNFKREEIVSRRRTFDPVSRAARWKSVQRGLGYGQIAMVLGFLSLIMQSILALARGGEMPNANEGPDSGQIAMAFGMLGLMMATFLFWILGRSWMMRVPYIPARSPARTSFILVLLSVGGIVASFCCMFAALGAMAQAALNGGGAADALLMTLMFMGVFGLTCAMLLGSEISFLVSLGRIGDGLKARDAAGWARRSIVVMLLALGLSLVGVVVAMVIFANAQKRRQAQAAPPPAAVQGAEAKDKNVGVKEKKKEDANAGPANPPPPEPEPLDPTSALIADLSILGSLLVYFLHVAVALQKGRRAIGYEIARLTESEGPASEHDPVHRF